MRYLTLSFDDGFRRSSLKTAELYEKHGLRAEFNVFRTGPGPATNPLPRPDTVKLLTGGREDAEVLLDTCWLNS